MNETLIKAWERKVREAAREREATSARATEVLRERIERREEAERRFAESVQRRGHD